MVTEHVTPCQGLVATLRDGFGFIECEDRSCEVFFSFRYVVMLTGIIMSYSI